MLDELAKAEPYLPDLKYYCRSLAGNDWDADDLMQEVLAKVLHAVRRAPERPVSRAFLFRIAKNAWIDRFRMERKRQDDTAFDEEYHQTASFTMNEGLARELLERLAESLNPRQMVLVILIDAFAFTASESAKLLNMTEGAVKEGLRRARRRVHAFAGADENAIARGGQPRRRAGGETPAALFESFVTGFRSGDAGMICRAYLSLAAQGITIEKATAEHGRYSFTLRDPDGHLIGLFQHM